MSPHLAPLRAVGAHAAALIFLAAIVGCGSSSGASAPPLPPPIAPQLYSATPTAGIVGTVITIQGVGLEELAPLESVFFGDTQARIDSADPATIVCAVPPGVAPGDAPISVTTRRGTATAPFEVLAGPGGSPLLTSVSPAVGPPGTTIRIAGAGFSAILSENEVTLAQSPVRVTTATETELVATIPAGAVAGKVVVSVAGGPPSIGRTFFTTSAYVPSSLGTVGDANLLYITASPRTHLVIEVDVEDGVPEPTDAALADLATELGRHLQKPGGIAVVRDPLFPATGVTTWTVSSLQAQDRAVRACYDGSNVATLHYSLVGGTYEEVDALGITYSASSITLFQERLVSIADPSWRATIEAAVLVHEAGHVLGLVDLGTLMVTAHEDPAYPAHCVSEACVMHHDVRIGGSTFPSKRYDDACVEDLRATGGK